MKQSIPRVLGKWYQMVMIGDCTFCILADDGWQTKIGFTLVRSQSAEYRFDEMMTQIK
ncbi:MAG: hypothetical protein RM347_009855 [Nostoc sp. ChiQUE02]|uniref:hypothetical protein n=1 Tax=Nostoc sp. ChiQUE02 TaxID=3075377 RepID=UPI002AD4B1D0|nr:hypothetical protein [Nostoc sp. ChiQUE02]MDZ8233864.1 hypothetical protein [Nostoc sp. ChiQUE02]